jgi:hypothetical protein
MPPAASPSASPEVVMPPSPPVDALLCESCGYALAGIHADSACPECGRPVAVSLPERRTGTAWQRRHITGWVMTSAATLRHPVRIWRDVSVGSRSMTVLMIFNCAVAAAVPAVAVAASGGRSVAIPIFGMITGILVALCGIEYVGIRFFGSRRGWRVSHAVAEAIIGHASIGWVVGGLAACMTIVVGQFMRQPVVTVLTVPIDLRLAFLSGPAAIGLLTFETLVYIGVRHMRFANAPVASPKPHDEPAESE